MDAAGASSPELRPINGLDLPDVAPAALPDWLPEVRQVDPVTLFVDEKYQRGLSDRSMRLIRKIVSQWSWLAFKPPIVVDVEGKLHVIDGQHTAIGAVTHGGIGTMPVLVVRAKAVGERASAFVRHNRDRIQVTATQLHAALVAAGDEDALDVAAICERAGIRLLKNPPPMARYKARDCVAISAIMSLEKPPPREGCAGGNGGVRQDGRCARHRQSDPGRRAAFVRQRIQGRNRRRSHRRPLHRHARLSGDRGAPLCGRTKGAHLAGAGLGHFHEPEEGAWIVWRMRCAIVSASWKNVCGNWRRRYRHSNLCRHQNGSSPQTRHAYSRTWLPEKWRRNIYSGRSEEPGIKIVDVFICKLRRKIKPFGVSINTIWGQGWALERKAAA